jgi:serralysin
MNKRLLLITTLAVAAIAAPAQAADTTAKVSSSSSGVLYLGTDLPDTVTFTASPEIVLIDDSHPLQIGAGCFSVTGDATKATCTLSRPHISAYGNSGRDKIVNNTSVAMFASGGKDDDKLVGGSAPDQLYGESGDFDTVQGNGGADVLSGGTGVHDLASYADKGVGVNVRLADQGHTFGNGVAGENDDLEADLEDLQGGAGLDTLIGNAKGNTLLGGASFDVLSGHGGADVLAGQDGDDILLSNDELGNPQRFLDGAADILNGGDGGDLCAASLSEGDTKSRCEF